MPEIPKRTLIVLFCVAIGLVLLTVFVLYQYISPSGWKARENAILSQIESDEVASYQTLEGTEIDFLSYQSDILIVNIWASWSPYTQSDLTLLGNLKEKLGEKVVVRALNRMETKETAEAYLNTIGKEEGIEYIIDTTDHLYDSLGGYAMPETLVFDSIGNILLHERGALSNPNFTSQIETLLTKEK